MITLADTCSTDGGSHSLSALFAVAHCKKKKTLGGGAEVCSISTCPMPLPLSLRLCVSELEGWGAAMKNHFVIRHVLQLRDSRSKIVLFGSHWSGPDFEASFTQDLD